MVSTPSVSNILTQQDKTSNASSQLAKDFTQFLTLLTTQLQNQDPLSPMDTTEFTNQLVAFSGVEQQINTNQKLDNLLAFSSNNAMGSALNYVGMDVSYISSEFNYEGAGTSKINYAFEGAPITAKIRIYDEDGILVRESDIDKNVGNNTFEWDGKDKNGATAPAGTYSIKIDALDVEDKPVAYTTVVTGTARGVETQNGTLFLLVGDRAVSIANVLNASQPRTTQTASN